MEISTEDSNDITVSTSNVWIKQEVSDLESRTDDNTSETSIKQEVGESNYTSFNIKQEEIYIKDEKAQNSENGEYQTSREHIKGPTRLRVNYKCSTCDYETHRKTNYTRHLRLHTGEQPFSCTSCDYKTSWKSCLLNHLTTHTGKPFACTLCDYKCSQKSHLRDHLKIHTKEKSFSCTLCNYKYSRKRDLKYHLQIHTGEKQHACTFCDLKCARKMELIRHLRIHTGEKPFSCKDCDYKSARKESLSFHLRIHTGEKPFACDFCEYRALRKSHIRRHMKTHTDKSLIVLKDDKKSSVVQSLKHQEFEIVEDDKSLVNTKRELYIKDEKVNV